MRARATAAQARALLKKNKTNYKRGCVVVYIHIPWLFLQKNFFCLSMEKKIPFFIISQLVINLLHLLPSCFHTLRLFFRRLIDGALGNYKKAHSHFINTLVARYLALVCFERKKSSVILNSQKLLYPRPPSCNKKEA